MKLFGRILVGIVAMVLAGLAVYGVGVVIKNNNDKNSSNDTNVTLSIQEARELVDNAYTACKGGESGSLAPAAVYEKEYVEEGNADAAKILGIVNEILKSIDNKEGYFMYHDSWGQNFVAYELTKSGIKVEHFGDEDHYDKDDGKIGAVTVLNCYYNDNQKDSWTIELVRLRGDNNVYVTDETEENFNKYLEWGEIHGIGNKARKMDVYAINVTKSYFGADQLTHDHAVWIMHTCYDSIKHEQFMKWYGEHMDGYEDMTDDEANEVLVGVQSRVKKEFVGKVYDRNKYVELKTENTNA